MSLSDELILLDAIAQADLVRRKQVKPIELVDAAIARIEDLNPSLNAVITPLFEPARTTARGTLPEGPFCGVPFLLKDLLASYAGVRMSAGSAFLRDFVPDHDSELVVRLKRAGLIILGKTNTPEFGLLPTTEPILFGPSRNPWDPTRARADRAAVRLWRWPPAWWRWPTPTMAGARSASRHRAAACSG